LKKDWLDSKKVIQQYIGGQHIGVDIGVITIDPSKIIGLCIDYDFVINDERMKKLKDIVASKGWKDPNPETLSLTELPTGEFIVSTGGNHRSVLANELGIKEIYAAVYRLYPKNTFPPSVLDSYVKLQEEKLQIEETLTIEFDEYSDKSYELINRLDEVDVECHQLFYGYLKCNNMI